jgi:hypothetical protein
MSNINDIKAELESLGSSLPFPADVPLSLPDGYFEGFPAAMLAKIKADPLTAAEETAAVAPLLAGLSKKMPYSLPADYFTANLSGLSELIAEDATPSFGKTAQPYSVPTGYFDALPTSIMARVAAGQDAKVVPMKRRSWIRLAVAAAVISLIALSGIFYFTKEKAISVDNPQWVAKSTSTVSTTSLDEFIKSTAVPAAASASNNTADVKALVKDIPTQELDQFLSSLPVDDEGYN